MARRDARFRRPERRIAMKCSKSAHIFSARTGRRRCPAYAKWCIDTFCDGFERHGRDAEAGGAYLCADTGPLARRCDAEYVSAGLANADARSNRVDVPFWTFCRARNGRRDVLEQDPIRVRVPFSDAVAAGFAPVAHGPRLSEKPTHIGPGRRGCARNLRRKKYIRGAGQRGTVHMTASIELEAGDSELSPPHVECADPAPTSRAGRRVGRTAFPNAGSTRRRLLGRVPSIRKWARGARPADGEQGRHGRTSRRAVLWTPDVRCLVSGHNAGEAVDAGVQLAARVREARPQVAVSTPFD